MPTREEIQHRRTACEASLDHYHHHEGMMMQRTRINLEYVQAECEHPKTENCFGMQKCLDSGKYAKLVSDDMAYGSTLGVSGTPTAFINGQKIVGAQPFANFKAVIDDILK